MTFDYRAFNGAIAVALALVHPTVAWSENLALVLSNSRYAELETAKGAANWGALVKEFGDAGFRVIGAQDLSASSLQQAATEMQDAVQSGGIDRIAVVLSGHFVAGARDTWLLGKDAGDLSSITVATAGLSVSALVELAGEVPGKALVVLMPSEGASFPAGYNLKAGIGAFDIAQGVTVAQGPSRPMQRWIGASVLSPGTSLFALAQAAPDQIQMSGFISKHVNFSDTVTAQVPQVKPAEVTEAAKERAFWTSANNTGTAASFEQYLQRYPQGAFAADARARIAAIRDTPEKRAEAGEAALSLNRDQRRDVQRDLSLLGFDPRGIDGVFGPGTRAALRAHQRSLDLPETGFLGERQLQRLQSDAAQRAETLAREAQERRDREEVQDRSYWDSVGRGGDEAGVRAYLERYPDGVFADVAQQRLNQLDDDRRQQAAASERAAWDRVRAQDNVQAYNQFLTEFPEGSFTKTARARIAELQNDTSNKDAIDAARAEESRVAGNQVVRLLVETQLSQIGVEPGAVDGNFDAETRRAIRRFQQAADLPVTGFVTQATMVRLLASGVLRKN